MRVPHVPQNVGWISVNPVFSPQCGQKSWTRSIDRVQCGQGAVRTDRLPEGVEAIKRGASMSADGTGRSWNAARPPDNGRSSAVESVGRMRQPQWAQKL
jgi:hypothetical protein